MWLDIVAYRDFYDFPRMFVVEDSRSLFLFDCPFDDELDDYPRKYTVYELKGLNRESLPTDWTALSGRASRCLGTVSLERIRFDATKRRRVEVGGFRNLHP